MLHAHNVALGDALKACGVADEVRVIPMALPDSINTINDLPDTEKPYHLPIVTTLDFEPAINGNAPQWHGYGQANADLKFVANLYEVAFGVMVFDDTIQSPSDLIGKRIAVPARPSSVRWFSEALLRDGWGILDQVEFVDTIPPQVPGALARGEIDAVAWNIMSQTPEGYSALLPMLPNKVGARWLNVSADDVDAINTANPFTTEQVPLAMSSIIGADNADEQVVNLLSFRQALAAWDSTPDALVEDIISCLAQADLPFGGEAPFTETKHHWPGLTPEQVHPAAK